MKFCLHAPRSPHVFSLDNVAGDGNCFCSSLAASPSTAFCDSSAARNWLITQVEKELLSECKGNTIKEHWAKSGPDAALEQWESSNHCSRTWGGNEAAHFLTSFLNINIVMISNFPFEFFTSSTFIDNGFAIEDGTNAMFSHHNVMGSLAIITPHLNHVGSFHVERGPPTNAVVYKGKAPQPPTS